MIRLPDRPSFCLIDSTLRDGEQAPGVVIPPARKLELATELARLGVGEIECGTPAMGRGEQATIRAMLALDLPCRLTGWCRARREDLLAAREVGLRSVHLSLPISDLRLASLGKDRPWVLETLACTAGWARDWFDDVSFGVQDVARADRPFLLDVARAAFSAGVDRLRLADTVGVWNPLRVMETVLLLRQDLPDLPLGVHTHNDLGMATANTIAALQAGARFADVTILGVGERAGNAPLEEVVLAAETSLGLDSGISTEGLNDFCRLTAQILRRPIPADKPIVGEDIFRHESGLHVQGLLNSAATFEAFPPETVGRHDRRILIGKHTGKAALRHALSLLGLDLPGELAEPLLQRVRATAENNAAPLTPARLLQLYSDVKNHAAEKKSHSSIS